MMKKMKNQKGGMNKMMKNLDINSLKDIDKYTSFKNGAFIYDLGKYQGTLLVNYIEQLQDRIDKAIEYIKEMKQLDYFKDNKNLLVLLEILGDKENE